MPISITKGMVDRLTALEEANFPYTCTIKHYVPGAGADAFGQPLGTTYTTTSSVKCYYSAQSKPNTSTEDRPKGEVVLISQMRISLPSEVAAAPFDEITHLADQDSTELEPNKVFLVLDRYPQHTRIDYTVYAFSRAKNANLLIKSNGTQIYPATAGATTPCFIDSIASASGVKTIGDILAMSEGATGYGYDTSATDFISFEVPQSVTSPLPLWGQQEFTISGTSQRNGSYLLCGRAMISEPVSPALPIVYRCAVRREKGI